MRTQAPLKQALDSGFSVTLLSPKLTLGIWFPVPKSPTPRLNFWHIVLGGSTSALSAPAD